MSSVSPLWGNWLTLSKALDSAVSLQFISRIQRWKYVKNHVNFCQLFTKYSSRNKISFQQSFEKPEPKWLPRDFRTKVNIISSQEELKVKTVKLTEVRGSMGDKVAIDLNFVSDWLRGRCEFSQLVAERSKEKNRENWIICVVYLEISPWEIQLVIEL